MKLKEAKFDLGQIVITRGAAEALQDKPAEAATMLYRHATGDWGDLDKHDKRVNEQALKNGERLLSAYTASDDVQVWIITEYDRSVTTILLPDEY